MHASYDMTLRKWINIQKGISQVSFINLKRRNDATNNFTKDARVTQGHFISRDKGSGCMDMRPSLKTGKCLIHNNKDC